MPEQSTVTTTVNENEQQPSFLDALPDEYKNNFHVNKYKSLEEFAKGHVNLAELALSKYPDEKSKPEDWAKFNKAIGVPEKPEDYKLSDLDKLPDAIKYSEEGIKEFQKLSHEISLRPYQADKLHKWYAGQLMKNIEQEKKAKDESLKFGVDSLKKEWGNDYDKNLKGAEDIVLKAGGEKAFNAFAAMPNSPEKLEIIKMLSKLSSTISEDSIKGLGGTPAMVETAQTAQAQIKEVLSAPKTGKDAHPYFNENHPQHQEWVEKMIALYRKANG